MHKALWVAHSGREVFERGSSSKAPSRGMPRDLNQAQQARATPPRPHPHAHTSLRHTPAPSLRTCTAGGQGGRPAHARHPG